MFEAISALVLHAVLASTPFASVMADMTPNIRTPVARLAPPGLRHHEVLRIHQDFHPNEDYEIALDGWVADDRGLVQVRMWWLDTANADERSPFGSGVRRHIAIDYTRHDDRAWRVEILQGRKRFAFEVELAPDRTPRAYGTVETEDGRVIDHCRIDESRLVSRRLLGIPTGLRRLDVGCTDDVGRKQHGKLM